MKRRLVLAALGSVALAMPFASALSAEEPWPSRPINFIVPFPAGGPTDTLSRKLAQQLQAALGQPVIVENVGGAMGAIGLAKLHRAPHDGYTIGLGAHSTQAIAPHQVKLPYDPRSDFQAIGGTVTFAYVLVANPSEPARTIPELVARSKQVPGGMTFGSSGPGGGNHLAGELLRMKTGAVLLHVPYKGVAPATADVIAGHVGFMFDVVASALPNIKAGKVRPIAVTGSRRSPLLPDVPAIAETVPGFDGVGWFAIFGTKGMPEAVTRRLNAEIDRIYATPEFADYLKQNGYDPEPGPPDRLAKRVLDDYKLWGEVMAGAGIKPE